MPGNGDDTKGGASDADVRAAEGLSVHISGALGERPLTRSWRATAADGTQVALVVVRESAPKAERERFSAAAERLRGLGELPGLLKVRRVSPLRDAYLADLWTTGTAKDLDALGWSVRRRLEFVKAVAQALDSLHKAGATHGCLCEENILLADDLKPVLAEAGSVSVHEMAERGGDAASYAAFAAPEVNEGAQPDARSDVYALGRLIQHVLRADDVPQIADIVRRCVAPAPAGRYASAGELGAAVEGALHDLPRGDAAAARPAPAPPLRQPAAEEKLEALGPSEMARAQPGPSARWTAPAGGLMVAASIAGAFGGVGANAGLRGLLSVALVVGVALGAWTVRPQERTPTALRVALALALAALVVSIDPLGYAYRFTAAQTITHGKTGSRRAAIEEIVRLGRDFRGMSLAGADLAGIDLRGADLREADLSGSNLSRANLWGALLAGTSLDGAGLFGADLRHSDFASALHMNTAACDAKTLLPEPWLCRGGHPKEDAAPGTRAPAP